MTLGIVFGFILFVVGVWLIVEPLIRTTPVCDREQDSGSDLPADSHIDELELDYRTGKMSEGDYRALKAASAAPETSER